MIGLLTLTVKDGEKMKKLILGVFFVSMLCSCTMAPSWDEVHRAKLIAYADHLEYEVNHLTRAVANGGSVAEVVSSANSAGYAASNALNECENVKEHYPTWIDCMGFSRKISETSATMMLTAGSYAVKKGDKEVAKKVYRDIITTYTGQAYKSYVKQAEFGLEDLK